jgi:predicted nucleic acid-binding protein
MKDKRRLIDTNILVYAYDSSEKTKHRFCQSLVRKIWEEGGAFITLQNLMEFFVVVTRKVENPLSIEDAKIIIEDILASKKWTVIDRDASTFTTAIELVRIHKRHFWDALIAACMLENNIEEIVTENSKDFENIPDIATVNPFKKT